MRKAYLRLRHDFQRPYRSCQRDCYYDHQHHQRSLHLEDSEMKQNEMMPSDAKLSTLQNFGPALYK